MRQVGSPASPLLAVGPALVDVYLVSRILTLESRPPRRWGADAETIVAVNAHPVSSATRRFGQDGPAFTNVVGSTCRVSIKMLYTPEGDRFAVQNVVVPRHEADGADPNAIDWVDENTDFNAIMTGASHYFSNDLVAALRRGYRNSHWTPERPATWDRDDSYPYRSTIIWPVQARAQPRMPTPRWSTLGFLCLDSTAANAFDSTLDLAIGEAVAQTLYSVWPLQGSD